MKKFISVILSVFLFSFISAEDYYFSKDYSHADEYKTDVPELLKGIWQGEDRLILFTGENAPFTCILRVFYQWYDDRAAESASYSQISTRDKNNTTAVHPENIELSFKTILENKDKTAGAWEIRVKYPGLKEYVYIPVAVMNGNLYLKFYYDLSALKNNEKLSDDDKVLSKEGSVFPANDKDLQNQDKNIYLLDGGTSSGITICPPLIKKELLCYFSSGNSIYHIRYWLSDMEQTEEEAEFLDGTDTFNVPKYIQSSGKLYTCTTGRSHRIRNIQKSSSYPHEFICDSQKLLYVFDKPYLVYVPGSGTTEKLLEGVKKNNSRVHPPLKPLFPVSNIDFHWKEIGELEKYNPYTWNKRNLDIHK